MINRKKIYHPLFRFCPFCGNSLHYKHNNNVLRPLCLQCGYAQYLNPTVGVAVVLVESGKILLGKRNRPPFPGKWCIPCGHVEWGEDVREAAAREFEEETGLKVRILDILDVHSNFHNPKHLTVGLWFLGKRIGGTLKAGDDLDEVAFFPIEKIDVELAFPTDVKVIKRLRSNQKQKGV